MCYLYSSKFTTPFENEIVGELREELYLEKYEEIDWFANLHSVADIDNYSPIQLHMKLLQQMLVFYDKNCVQSWRDSSLDFAIQYIMEEDKQTNHVCIGPVNKVLN